MTETAIYRHCTAETSKACEETLLASPPDGCRWAVYPSTSVHRVFLDCFDWRLYNGGWRLCAEQRENEWLLELSDAQGALLATTRFNDLPILPLHLTTLPDSPFRTQLEHIVENRAMIAIGTMDYHVREFRLLDKEEKTRLRLLIEDWPAPGTDTLIDQRRILLPVRGYRDEVLAVDELLSQHREIQPGDADTLNLLLRLQRREPITYSNKIDCALHDNMTAGEAALTILNQQWKVFQFNFPGVLADIDAECLHDLRVSVRRIRSLLGQYRPVFSKDALDHARQEWAWFQTITNLPRDLDVYLEHFPDYQCELPPEVQPALEPLRTFISHRRHQAYAILRRRLESKRVQRFLTEWQSFLAQPPFHPQSHDQNAKELANRRIWRLYATILKEGMAIDDDSPPEPLHELRKSFKKLRYLVEFTQSIYPGDKVRSLIRIMKDVLDNLGTFQDLAVQISAMTEFANAMAKEQAASATTILAMGVLVGRLQERQMRSCMAFASIFETFTADDHRALFMGIYAGEQTP